MVEQAIEDVRGLAGIGCDDLGVERREAVGDMGVEQHAGIGAIAGVAISARLALPIKTRRRVSRSGRAMKGSSSTASQAATRTTC